MDSTTATTGTRTEVGASGINAGREGAEGEQRTATHRIPHAGRDRDAERISYKPTRRAARHPRAHPSLASLSASWPELADNHGNIQWRSDRRGNVPGGRITLVEHKISLGEALPVIRRPLVTAATLAALTLGLTACGNDDAPDSIPGAEPSATSNAPTEPTEPTETATTPTWDDDYTPKQARAYEAALQRWESYEQRSEPIWAKGKATPAAEALFQEFFPSPRWQLYYQRLEDYEQVDVKSEGLATVYWSRPGSITRNSLNVEILQCVDYSAISGSQNGEPVEPAPWATEPRLRTIQLSKPAGYDWLIYDLVDATSSNRPKTCTP